MLTLPSPCSHRRRRMQGPLSCPALAKDSAYAVLSPESTLLLYASCTASDLPALATIDFHPNAQTSAGRVCHGHTWEIIVSTPESADSLSASATTITTSSSSTSLSRSLRPRSSVKQPSNRIATPSPRTAWVKAKLRSKSVSSSPQTGLVHGEDSPLPPVKAKPIAATPETPRRRMSFSQDVIRPLAAKLPSVTAMRSKEAYTAIAASAFQSEIVLVTVSRELQQEWIAALRTAISELAVTSIQSRSATGPSCSLSSLGAAAAVPTLRISQDSFSSIPYFKPALFYSYPAHTSDEGSGVPCSSGLAYNTADGENDEDEEELLASVHERPFQPSPMPHVRSISTSAVHAGGEYSMTVADEYIFARTSREERRASAPLLNPLLPLWLEQLRTISHQGDRFEKCMRPSRSSAGLSVSGVGAADQAQTDSRLRTRDLTLVRGIKISLHASSEHGSSSQSINAVQSSSVHAPVYAIGHARPPLLRRDWSSSTSTYFSPSASLNGAPALSVSHDSRAASSVEEDQSKAPMPSTRSYTLNPNRPISPLIRSYGDEDDEVSGAAETLARSLASAQKLASFLARLCLMSGQQMPKRGRPRQLLLELAQGCTLEQNQH